jgi:tRNA pseudouridine55 synthase
MKSGFFLVNKPSGITSSDLVQIVRKRRGLKKIGHTGTLDKFADGLLILPFGNYTCFSDLLLHFDKTYLAKIKFGKSTDTGDGEGTVLEEWEPERIQSYLHKQKQVLYEEIILWLNLKTQIPPKVSALKIGGKRQSDLFRKGIEFESKPRNISIFKVNINQFTESGIEVDLKVSSGTYIRKLVIDLSEKINFPLHLEKLTRKSIHQYSLEKAKSLEEITENISEFGYELDQIFDFPKKILSDKEVQLVRHGGYISQPIESNYELFYTQNKELIAWVEKKDSKTHLPYFYKKVFTTQT